MKLSIFIFLGFTWFAKRAGEACSKTWQLHLNRIQTARGIKLLPIIELYWISPILWTYGWRRKKNISDRNRQMYNCVCEALLLMMKTFSKYILFWKRSSFANVGIARETFLVVVLETPRGSFSEASLMSSRHSFIPAAALRTNGYLVFPIGLEKSWQFAN